MRDNIVPLYLDHDYLNQYMYNHKLVVNTRQILNIADNKLNNIAFAAKISISPFVIQYIICITIWGIFSAITVLKNEIFAQINIHLFLIALKTLVNKTILIELIQLHNNIQQYKIIIF